MTLVEFISPVLDAKNREKVLAVLYWCERFEQKLCATTAEVRGFLAKARFPNAKKMNVSDVLNKSGLFVDCCECQDRRSGWHLTSTGRKHISGILFPTSTSDLADPRVQCNLQAVIEKIADETVERYAAEAVKCLNAGAFRAAIVFLWSGAIRILQKRMLNCGKMHVNSSLRRHDANSRGIRRIDDFAYIRDAVTLQAAQDLGILDKSQKGALEEALNLRNRCGHPSKYWPGRQRVAGFIEDVVGIVMKQ